MARIIIDGAFLVIDFASLSLNKFILIYLPDILTCACPKFQKKNYRFISLIKHYPVLTNNNLYDLIIIVDRKAMQNLKEESKKLLLQYIPNI